MTSEKSSGRPEPAYFLSEQQNEQLRWDLYDAQSISLEMMQAFQETEQRLGTLFLEVYKDRFNLTQEQVAYMTEQRVHVVTPDIYRTLRDIWPRRLKVNKDKKELHGEEHMAYKLKEQIEQADNLSHELFLHGKVPVYVLVPGFENRVINLNDIVSLKKLEEWHIPQEEIRKSLTNRLRNSRVSTLAKDFALVVIHEKIHGIQDYNLPFPILETYAYYLSQQFLEENIATQVTEEEDSFAEAILFFSDLLERYKNIYGDDIHKTILGTLEDKTRNEEIIAMLKKEFSEEVMAKIFQKIEWVTEPIKSNK